LRKTKLIFFTRKPDWFLLKIINLQFMKNKLLVFLVTFICLVFTGIIAAAPSEAESQNKAENTATFSKLADAEENKQETVQKKEVQNLVIDESYVRNLIMSTFNQMLSQGLLKGEKGDPGLVSNSIDPDIVGFQTAYIPGAFVGPDVGTVFAATNLSSDVLTSNSASFSSLELSGDLTAEGGVNFSGETSMATTSVTALSVSTITSQSGAYLSEGGDWVNASSKELKENLATTSPQSILDKIAGLPIYTWNYKNQNPSNFHIGPMAEDFYEKFGFGNSSTSISTIDPAGVALAGIQGLNERIKTLTDLSWILEALKKIGVEISESLVKVKNLAADIVSTKKLEVGSNELPSGITIYDSVTREPLCISSENSSLKLSPGKCGQNNFSKEQPENSVKENLEKPPVEIQEAIESTADKNVSDVIENENVLVENGVENIIQ
jgi:hypothetical protein